MLALHALVSTSDADAGREVPFYLQRTLGGPDDLRGFRRFRFRDRHMLLLQAEYRWEIFTAVDGAIFYDAGKVASRLEDLTCSDLESDYGIGFRFGTDQRRLPARRRGLRQQRRQALHLQVRSCLLIADASDGDEPRVAGFWSSCGCRRPHRRQEARGAAEVLPRRSDSGGRRPRVRRQRGAADRRQQRVRLRRAHVLQAGRSP